ncbi:MAG TPA: hypothetical protein VL120_02220 [Solirubrobacteraceae bacterium]|nr:hypothetical protein [Solirubrobacteraceae bacterium]
MAPATLECASVEVATRELAHRRAGALDIYLLWHPADDSVSIRVEDLRTGVRVDLDVDQGTALEAFRHPFSYAP